MDFKTVDYNRFEGEIMCESETGEQKAICEKKLHRYLTRNDLLNWELNYSDDAGEHVQETGVMSLDEYFETDRDNIMADLSKFIADANYTRVTIKKEVAHA